MTRRIPPWTIFVVAAFALVYALNQTFVYVEGDDATSIAFHALGRSADLQPPYASYNGMMDFLLGLLPASEPVVRVTAISLTMLGGVLMTVFALQLAFAWLGQTPSEEEKLLAHSANSSRNTTVRMVKTPIRT